MSWEAHDYWRVVTLYAESAKTKTDPHNEVPVPFNQALEAIGTSGWHLSNEGALATLRHSCNEDAYLDQDPEGMDVTSGWKAFVSACAYIALAYDVVHAMDLEDNSAYDAVAATLPEPTVTIESTPYTEAELKQKRIFEEAYAAGERALEEDDDNDCERCGGTGTTLPDGYSNAHGRHDPQQEIPCPECEG